MTISKGKLKFADDFFRKGEQKFLRKAFHPEQIPSTFYPEFLFVGRSNVGKSTLINKLLMRTNLLRVSRTPGCTIQLHFHQIANQLIIVDSPGYGYAKNEKLSLKWKELLSFYFQNRENLHHVFVLIDGRRGILDVDYELFKILESYGIDNQIVLTKMDKKDLESDLVRQTKLLQHDFSCVQPELIYCSALKNRGFSELRATILANINK